MHRNALVVFDCDKDWLQLARIGRGPAEIPERCATWRRKMLWLMNRHQPGNCLLSLASIVCHHRHTLHGLGDNCTAACLLHCDDLIMSCQWSGATRVHRLTRSGANRVLRDLARYLQHLRWNRQEC